MRHPLSNLLVHLRRVALAPVKNQGTDAELLSRFVKHQDNLAFELLFWRHGPMVWGVCRRLLGNSPDAEDAFQATFVILARKARSVGNGAALSGWLHRVARHTALNARKALSRREAHEQSLADLSQYPGRNDLSREASENELKALIDDEIAKLPEKFRVPLILCDIESRTHEAAAAELGCPLGTLKSRVARAREKLKERLLRRGISSAGLPCVPVPLGLASAALEAASRSPSAPVLALAQSVIWALTLTAAKKVAAAAAVCCLLALGIAGGIAATRTGGKSGANEQQVGKDEARPEAKAIPKAQAKELPKDPVDQVNFIDPDGGRLPPDAVARIGSMRLRHTDFVAGLAYSPDSKWLASISTGSQDGTARLWDAITGKEKLRVKVKRVNYPWADDPSQDPHVLGFSADSRRFLVIDAESIRSIDIESGKELSASALPRPVVKAIKMDLRFFGAGFSPDAKTFVVHWGSSFSMGTRIIVCDTASAAIRTEFNPGQFMIRDKVEFSSDGRRFIVGRNNKDRAIPVFDAESGQPYVVLDIKDPDNLGNLRFVPGGEVLVGLWHNDRGRQPPALVYFDVKTGKLQRQVEVNKMTSAIAVSPDGKTIVAASWGTASSQIIDTGAGKEIGRIPISPMSTVKHLAYSPNGRLLAVAYWGSAITVWDFANRRHLPASALPNWFGAAHFSPDSKALMLPGVKDEESVIVDWQTGKVIRRLPAPQLDPGLGPVRNTLLSPNQRIFALRKKGGAISLTDAVNGKEIRTLTGHTENVFRMAFSGDNSRFASRGMDDTIRVWDVATGNELAKFTLAEKFPLGSGDDLVISGNGNVVAASFRQAAKGAILQTWDVAAKVPLARVEVAQGLNGSVHLSPDGRWLAGGVALGDNKNNDDPTNVIIWNASTGRIVHSLPGHQKPDFIWRTTSCSFSPNNQWLVTGDGKGQLRLWEALSGMEMYRFEGHRFTVTASFSLDSKLLVAASDDAPCFVWDVLGTAREPGKNVQVDMEQLWRYLADGDAKKAFLAMRQLAAAPGPAVELMRKSLKPRTVIDGPTIDKLIGDLDSSKFAVRNAATSELMKIAEHIESALAKARGTAPLEVRTRLAQILEKTATPSPERLRQSRALGALEWIATPAAARLLADLAAGNRNDSLTIAAAAASKRLRMRGVK